MNRRDVALIAALRRSSRLGNWQYLSLDHGCEGDGYRIELRWKEQVIYGEDQRGFLFDPSSAASRPAGPQGRPITRARRPLSF